MTPHVLLRLRTLFSLSVIASAGPIGVAAAQVFWYRPTDVRVINIMPQGSSNETNQDSEPNLAVNPANISQIAASAFTPSNGLCAANSAPIYISADTGRGWAFNCIVPSDAAGSGTGDITLRFTRTGGALHGGILRRPALIPGVTRMNILRTPTYNGAALMTVMMDRNQPDQPYIQATTAGAREHVYVGNNDFAAPGGRTATIDTSLDAGTAGATYGAVRIDPRATSGQNGPPIRTAFHVDSTVYGVYLGRWVRSGAIRTVDVVVVRDDDAGTNGFTALTDPGDGLSGRRVVRNAALTWNLGSAFGQERLSAQLSIAVSPQNSDMVYVAWGDTGTTNTPTIHVRRSMDRGANWDTADRLTIPSAINPSLAINSRGVVALLYQELATVAGVQRWITHVQSSGNGFTSARRDTLATVLANTPVVQFGPYIGDYVHLLAVGSRFFGVFSANNTPNNANFPRGVTFLRNANFAANTLLGNDGVTPVAVSIDPFFFTLREIKLSIACERFKQLLCDQPRLLPGVIELRCSVKNCVLIDPIPKNCLVKFQCPGCQAGGYCPTWYHFRFEGLKDHWDVSVIGPDGELFGHEIVRDGPAVIVSLQPERVPFWQKDAGDYSFVFQRKGAGKRIDERYVVRTSVAAGDQPYKIDRKEKKPGE